jgi:hypothetical protein
LDESFGGHLERPGVEKIGGVEAGWADQRDEEKKARVLVS